MSEEEEESPENFEPQKQTTSTTFTAPQTSNSMSPPQTSNQTSPQQTTLPRPKPRVSLPLSPLQYLVPSSPPSGSNSGEYSGGINFSFGGKFRVSFEMSKSNTSNPDWTNFFKGHNGQNDFQN